MNQPANPIRSRSKWGSRLMILFIVGLFLVPVGFALSGGEGVQWKAAVAIRKYESGERETAIDELRSLVEQSRDTSLSLRLIQWLTDAGQVDEAIEKCDLLLSQIEDPEESFYGFQASILRANCLIMQERYREAVATVYSVLSLDADGNTRGVRDRNALAYYRGICKIELRSALGDINSVLREFGRRTFSSPTNFHGQTAVAAGLVSRYTGQREVAVELIARRLKAAEAELDSGGSRLGKRLYQLMRSFIPLDDELSTSTNLSRERFEQLQNEVVALKSVLALLLDDLGDRSASMELRRQVSEDGTTCEDVLEQLPTEFMLLEVLENGAMFLDTRAVIMLGLKEYERALADMDLAILAIEVRMKSLDSEVQNSSSAFGLERGRQEITKSAATLYNHRMQIYEAMGDAEKAELDRQRVIELGFEPGPDLF